MGSTGVTVLGQMGRHCRSRFDACYNVTFAMVEYQRAEAGDFMTINRALRRSAFRPIGFRNSGPTQFALQFPGMRFSP
jgi:hypothetical protein